MKKLLVVAVVLVAVMVVAGSASAAALVAGTKHDIRSIATATGTAGFATGEVCVYCHTPHSANEAVLIWNRAGAVTTGYAPYSNPGSIQGAISATMGSQTRVCLSCHDGAVAVFTMTNPPNAGGYVTGVTGASGNIDASGQIAAGSNPNLTADFTNDHPVSVTVVVADTGLETAANMISAGLPLYGAGNDTVECGTCHAVHDNTTAPFLRISNAGSAMCITCHINK